jgi:hypothetical protein
LTRKWRGGVTLEIAYSWSSNLKHHGAVLFSFVPTALAVKTAGSLGYSILVYTDDPYHSVGENGPIIALDGMGYSYTYFYSDQDSFLKALETCHWDLVICNEENYRLQSEVFDELYAHVQSGGRLILCTWVMDQYPSHPLWASMGVSYASTSYSGVWTMYPWQAITHSSTPPTP